MKALQACNSAGALLTEIQITNTNTLFRYNLAIDYLPAVTWWHTQKSIKKSKGIQGNTSFNSLTSQGEEEESMLWTQQHLAKKHNAWSINFDEGSCSKCYVTLILENKTYLILSNFAEYASWALHHPTEPHLSGCIFTKMSEPYGTENCTSSCWTDSAESEFLLKRAESSALCQCCSRWGFCFLMGWAKSSLTKTCLSFKASISSHSIHSTAGKLSEHCFDSSPRKHAATYWTMIL